MAAKSNANEWSSSTSSAVVVVVEETKKVPSSSFCLKRRGGSFSWGNPQTPFALPFLRLTDTVPNSSSNAEVRTSMTITTSAHEFFRHLHSLASQNPILSKLLSLPCQLHTLCLQIRCRSNSGSGNMRSSLLRSHNFAAVLPGGDSVAGLVVSNGIQNFLNIYNTLLVVRLVLTWFPNSPPAIVSPLSTICDPYLNIFRGLIPPLGGTLDLSPILAFLVLNVFTSSAAALPAELPVTEQPEQGHAPPLQTSDVTTSQKKWMRRLQGNKSRTSDRVN